MYPVSDAFLRAIESNTRKYDWTGTITTRNHQTYDFATEDIVKGSGYITRQCCGSTEIELGTVYAAELGITLLSDIDRYTLEGAEIRLYFHLVLPSGAVESIPMGVFEISEANRSVRCLELKAYDYMLRFEETLKLNSSSGTAYSFLFAACTACKVEMAQTKEEIDALPNGTETLGIYSDNDIETYRDLLFYVAQVLGCFCQIDREGRLLLRPYGNTPVSEITGSHRFSSTYSDFVTRYTAVSSTNMMTEEAEYFALDVDDALTMNLGVNPLLQFGLKTTRERLLRNILHAISVVNYLPFDSTTIGNPALDPGDILVFSGGHADHTKISYVTSITYKIGGKHSLKCVGKNPKLAAAKSKNDKNITGLLNQIEAGKIVVYNFINVSPFSIGNSPTEVLAITFTSKEETTATFLAEILLEVTADLVERTVTGTAFYETDFAEDIEQASAQVEKPVRYSFLEKGQPELKVIYKMNNEEVKTFYPAKTCIEGRHILTLFLPITQVIANSENTLAVYLVMEGGSLTIGESQIRATISGQGLVAGIGDWNGRISITEMFDRIPMTATAFGYLPFTDNAVPGFPKVTRLPVTQPFPQIRITDTRFSYHPLNERVTAVEVIKTFTLDEKTPPQYDQTTVEVNENGAFCLISDYVFVSAAEEVNYGWLQFLSVNTEPFERVEHTEVQNVSGI